MSVQVHRQGDILIQCSEVTSTTPCELSFFMVHGRHSYRNYPYRELFYIPPYRNFNNTPIRNNLNDPQMNQPVPEIPVPIDDRNNETQNISTRNSIIAVLLIFLTGVSILYLVMRNFPNVTPEEKKHIKVPWNIEEAKQLGIVLSRYKTDHYYQVMSGVFATYIFLQTFAIPGSLFLSILSGFLFPFVIALALVCTCSAIGASLCFMLSQILGRKLVLKYFPDRAKKWGEEVEKHNDNLLNYIIFLRVTPFLPNWFINLTAPVIGVPLWPFAFGTFLGVAPPSFIAIQGGQTLQSMTETDNAFSFSSLILLIVFGVLSLMPILFKNRLKRKVE